ncbi:MAG: hypothetical protein PHN37_01190 [Candidatus Pacebacteria bacterium]|nr:hypothetical protein [Candidatus Paceibacterota bacterium]
MNGKPKGILRDNLRKIYFAEKLSSLLMTEKQVFVPAKELRELIIKALKKS